VYRKEFDVAREGVKRIYSIYPVPPNIHLAISHAQEWIDLATKKMQAAGEVVHKYEDVLDISERWMESSPEYIKYHQEVFLTSYQKAIDELERLVIMRLFELTKMSASGMGEFSATIIVRV
jgi:hypothetical protein